MRLCNYAMSEILKKMAPAITGQAPVLDSDRTAEIVLKAREALDLPRKAVAIEAGLHISYLCDLEHGNRKWNMALFNRVKQAMERLMK